MRKTKRRAIPAADRAITVAKSITSSDLSEAGKLPPASLDGKFKDEDDDKKKKLPKVKEAEIEVLKEDPKKTGVMVALMLTPNMAEKLAIPGGEKPEDLHLTLAYLGHQHEMPADYIQRLEKIVHKSIFGYGAIKGTVSGIGVFTSKEEDSKDVVYASFDSTYLSKFREALMLEIEADGLPVRKEHGFTPHITLAYVPKNSKASVESMDNYVLNFRTVAIVLGNKIHKKFHFVSSVEKSADVHTKSLVITANDKTMQTVTKVLHSIKLFSDSVLTNKIKNKQIKVSFSLPESTDCTVDGLEGDTLNADHVAKALSSQEFSLDSIDIEKEENTNCEFLKLILVKNRNANMCSVCKKNLATHVAVWDDAPDSGIPVCNRCKPKDKRVSKDRSIEDLYGIDNRSRVVCDNISSYDAEVWFVHPTELIKKQEENVEKTHEIPITKIDQQKRIVTGIVLEPETIDAHGDIISEEVIEEAAHKFLAAYNRGTEMGYMHRIFGKIGVDLVESWLAKEDSVLGGQTIKKGTWLISVKVLDDKVWSNILLGKLNGFSIGGKALVA